MAHQDGHTPGHNFGFSDDGISTDDNGTCSKCHAAPFRHLCWRLGAVIIGMLYLYSIYQNFGSTAGPAIPFIMIGNALLVIVYLFRSRLGKGLAGSGIGLVVGAIIKFLVLSSAVRFIVSVPPPVAQAMQIPQLYTAILGGIVAIAVEKVISAAISQ